MIEHWLARLRLAGSLTLGVPVSVRSLERMVDTARETLREFGSIESVGPELGGGAPIDEDTRRWVEVRGFRKQAVRAATDTHYYAELFHRIGLDPAQLSWEEIGQVPTTPKEHLREHPDDFVREGSEPFLCALTTGTTGRSTCVSYSRREITAFASMAATHALVSGQIQPDDIVQVSVSLRSSLASLIAAETCARLGAASYLAGLIEPATSLQLLSEGRRLPGKRALTSMMLTYPSYLGELVEQGLALGYREDDFALRSITVSGEVVTQGLEKRARRLFGDVEFVQGYASTELDPINGTLCSEGHLHFQPSAGLVEVRELEGDARAGADEVGILVATPFGPLRETTMLLRYDTQDIVRALPHRPTCSLRNLPGVSKPLGRLSLCVKHDGGWTFQREVMEAIESVEAVRLPSRYGFWAVDDGVAVEVFARAIDDSVRLAVATALEEHGVPLRELHLVDDPRDLRDPRPVRADLRELSFEAGASPPPLVLGAR